MAEVLRAEAKTAGNSQRACKPRTYSAAPRPQVRAAARRSLVTFHRWKVTRRRRDQKTNTTRVTRKRHKRNKNCPPPPAQAVFKSEKRTETGSISRHKTAQKSEQ